MNIFVYFYMNIVRKIICHSICSHKSLFILSILFSFILSQNTITGSVRDNNGEILPGANVFIKSIGIGAIVDFDGNFVGWEPIVQYDLNAEQDSLHCMYSNTYDACVDTIRGMNFSGIDPMAERTNLGSNSGLQYTFLDSNVIDGVEYTYTITAYDTGLRTYDIDYFFFIPPSMN